ncbi:hypothetical protein [Actinoplanes nipponensis]|nr:hypothetical protein [Actinoplanes nipponensis]
MNTHLHRRGPAVVIAALTGLVCALTIAVGPAAAKHCQTCEDKDAPLPGVATAVAGGRPYA